MPGQASASGSGKKQTPNFRGDRRNESNVDIEKTESPFVFRISCGNTLGPTLLRKTLLEAGLIEFDPNFHRETQWNLWWKGFRFREEEFSCLTRLQRVNHHPAPAGTHSDIIKKDGLLRAVRRMCFAYPKCATLFNFPLTFHLPREENQFIAAFCQNAIARNKLHRSRYAQLDGTCDESCTQCLTEARSLLSSHTVGDLKSPTNIWILKPADSSRGKGIYLFNQLEHLAYVSKSIVQKYITNPLLIEGYKFDLRLYAVVPSYAPFIVYICDEGLVRFATERFDLGNLGNVFAHLTNSSINMNGPGYLTNKKGIGRGCKWTVKQLRKWMASQDLDDYLMWTKITVIIILTLLTQAPCTQSVSNAYEVFGFDILIDCHLNPWLIEVNANPSLSNDCIVDELVKKPLLSSVLQMVRLDQASRIGLRHPSNGCSLMSSEMTADLHTTLTNRIVYGRNRTNQKTVNLNYTGLKPEGEKGNEGAQFSCLGSLQELKNKRQRDLFRCKTLHVYSKDKNRASATFYDLPTDGIHGSLNRRNGDFINRNTRTINKNLVTQKSGISPGIKYVDFHRLSEPCPLYGPGSEFLLPRLHALGKRFSHLIDVDSRSSQLEASVNSLSSTSTTASQSMQLDLSCSTPSIRQTPCIRMTLRNAQENDTGSHLVAHSYGRLKLAFPFSLFTRIACARESGRFPDQKLVVRETARLVQYRAQQRKSDRKMKSLQVIDIPDVWEEQL